MKKELIAGSIILSLTGCIAANSNQVAPGQYLITSHGSIFNSKAGMLENINEKAATVCKGKPYHLAGDPGDVTVTYTPTQIGSTPTTMLSVIAVCDGGSE